MRVFKSLSVAKRNYLANHPYPLILYDFEKSYVHLPCVEISIFIPGGRVAVENVWKSTKVCQRFKEYGISGTCGNSQGVMMKPTGNPGGNEKILKSRSDRATLKILTSNTNMGWLIYVFLEKFYFMFCVS